MEVDEFHYQLEWRANTSHPGHHRSLQTGSGFEFRGHTSILRAPDPRRFDALASLRDPFEQIQVRTYNQRSAVSVYAVADLSASMGFEGRCRKLDVLADFVASVGYSAYRTGDRFAFFGCDSQIRSEFFVPLNRTKASGPEVARRLHEYRPTGNNSSGLLDAAQYLPKLRSLVFLCSDFYFPLSLLTQILTALSAHSVVPVVLWDSAEIEVPPHGIALVRDSESGVRRTLWLRPALRERIRSAHRERRETLDKCFVSHGLRALHLIDRFDPERATQYFYG